MRGSGSPKKRMSLRCVSNSAGIRERTGPLLTKYPSREYGQGIRCLFHLPSPYTGGGGKRGKEPLGILERCQVKRSARKVGGESSCPDKKPLQTRFGTTPQAESFAERHCPRLRG